MFKVQPKPQPAFPDVQSIFEKSYREGENLLYSNVQDDILTSVCTKNEADNSIKLFIRQCSIDKFDQIQTDFTDFQYNKQSICYAFIEGSDGFVVYANPFTIYYLNKNQNKPIKLILDGELYVQNFLIGLAYPNIMIMGTKKGQKRIEIIQINLQTLGVKTIQDGKNYSPCARTQSASILVDGRVYLFGGRDKNGKECDKMIWVYDMEKGYWFALQMDYPSLNYQQCNCIPITSSRVLITNPNSQKNWILQIHQSKLTQIIGQLDITGRVASIKGQIYTFCDNKWGFWGHKLVYVKNGNLQAKNM